MQPRFNLISSLIVVSLLAVACTSGPSAAVLERRRAPSTTTTTEAPPDGVVVIEIEDGRLSPSIVKIDSEEFWIVQIVHRDPEDRIYTIVFRGGEFEDSEPMSTGDVYEMDVSGMEPGLIRFRALLEGSFSSGLPGTINTRGN